MRLSVALLWAFVPAVALAQTQQIDDAIKAKLATAKWVYGLEDPAGGFHVAPADPKSDAVRKPSLRATSAAVRALKYSGAEVPNADKHAAFVLKCYDPATGGFAEPGGKPDVTLTSVGVMAAAELGIPHDKYPKAMEFLKANAKTFEDVRIGAAAVEAWGVKDCPFDLADWQALAAKDVNPKLPAPNNGGARFVGSYTAFMLRLGLQKGNDSKPAALAAVLDRGQLPDGGWNKEGEKASDVETTYRVMRAYMLLNETPKDAAAVRKFLAAHRNADGGYGTVPGGPSNVGGTYYAVTISKWLDAMGK
ncbi:Putative peptidase OS=Singulisphaera acidiphila (strain ATCC BAA-1392 / DSM 18658 / VKM B-2454 / MOB10) GN=Sinac_5574 PE=4 SV=1: Prenyltrans_2 [Gemmataceae bacterium]|nr:Putative peptidase OS=Singulisphaera acidiphila (strain ATCC BAA-1392 / DSM 18658 / VKM B-2454 / MOB10) GN=Sinac_5574 PE=4 SV=1: Prenyltrans_2 [Gemmataceae bacterium]VTT97556.1 Putative peptidase OS=Singulisphaera acidiphila (strain ATCC BAA-1392 / DSM 18658 / VKM B-2454 / MOB10) GN=Sinac_5574 PE=4 SV=1: Prenyltrans_2 [Gemmataceae bacterium]